MANRFARRGFLSVAMLVAVTACSSLPQGPRDISNEGTGATVTVVSAPITFSLAHSEQASHGFLTLVAIQRDDAGKYSDLILVYRWSVLYGSASSAPAEGGGKLLIEIDGRSIELQPLPQLPAGLPGPKDLYVPDTSEAALSAYVTDLETLRLIATSHELTVRLPQDSVSGPFEIWRDGRPALVEFVKHLGGS
jgi:hypothetical protein